MIPNGDNLQATFEVEGVRIKLENTTETVDTPEEQAINDANAQTEQTADNNQNNVDTTGNVVQ